MTKKHFHAIPAALRGSNHSTDKKVFVKTPHGEIEEGCHSRITTVFSDLETTPEDLVALRDALAKEYVAHIQLVDEVIERTVGERQAADKKSKAAPATDEVEAKFDAFMKGDYMGLRTYVAANKAAIAKLRYYNNGVVVHIQDGMVTVKRDNAPSTISLLYPLSTKLKLGDHVFIRDNGAKLSATALRVWVNVKDAALRGSQLRELFA
jgi:hypothetical protein